MLTLLEEDDVGHDLCTGVLLEGVIGQTDGSQEVSPLCQILTGIRVLGVHGVAAGHKCNHAAGTNLIQSLGEEVVVNGEAQLVVGLVGYLVVTEGDIAHRQIIEISAAGGFKARHGNVGLGIELLGDATGDGIQFHAVELAVPHTLRKQTEEVADAHRRLQNVAGFKAHLFNGFIDAADNGRTGVVSVQGGSSGGGVFLLGQKGFQFLIFGMAVIEPVGQTAPAHIVGENFLLLGSGVPSFGFQLIQGLDRSHIPGVFLTGASFTQVIVHDAEVLSVDLRLGRFFLQRTFDPTDDLQHLRILPTGYLGVVLNDGILSVLALDKIQTAGERTIGVHGSESLGLGVGQLPIGVHGVLKGTIFPDVQRTGLLQILHHVEVVDEVFGNRCGFDFRYNDLGLSLFVGIAAVNAEVFLLLLIIDGGTVKFEAIRLHRAVYIALSHFLCFLQSEVVQLFVKAVLDGMIGNDLIATLRLSFGLGFLCFMDAVLQTVVSLVLCEHFLELGTVFGTEYRIGQCGIEKLNLSVRNLLYPEGGIVQIDGITDLIIPAGVLDGIVHGQLLVIYLDQILEVQLLQLAMNQSFKGFILSGSDQYLTQITLDAEVHQIDIGLDGNFVIGDSSVGDADCGEVAEISSGIKLILTVAFDQLLRRGQLGILLGLGIQLSLPLLQRFGGKVAVELHKFMNTGGDLRPGQLHFLTAAFAIPDTLEVVILIAEIRTGQRMGVTTGAVFVLQELNLLLLTMGREEVVVNAALASFKVTAARQLLIDLVIGDEVADDGHIRHIGTVLSAGKLQFLQLLQDAVEVMMLETHQAPILLEGVQEIGVLRGQDGTELGIGQPFAQLLSFVGEALESLTVEDVQVVALTTLFAHITMQEPEGFCDLLTLMLGCFRKLHIGGEFALLQKLTDTLCGFRPGDHLCGLGIPGGASHCQMDAVIGIPRTDAPTVFLDAVAAVVAFLDEPFQLVAGLLLHKLRGDSHTAVLVVAAQHQNVVDFLLRKRKSRERFVLCFINHLNLFFLGEVEAQAQLLISSVITTSSACAFRLFMCCTQPI